MFRFNFFLSLIFLLAPFWAFSTHIVGGVLNYSYNGGNIYTVTLRLFRDCGAKTAYFPSNITILVKGNNGANFYPSKNLTISLGSVSSVTAATDPCAIPPKPMPCVQQGVYSKTISLPPNPGGYHMYYQLEARNLSLTNVNSSCNCIGESFYAYVPNYTVNTNANSNAVFTSFPPLFLCVNQGFSIDHSATDANGDSLVYSLYSPYNGDNGNGPLDPTFSNNTASFTPVNYVSGFTTNNPLGASPFTINPATGILTGTPGLTGQFVVGVRVREYRNGVYISETIRDFQFNVLNCPPPPPQPGVSNQVINNGCSKKVMAVGFVANTTTWTSVYPGTPGAYDNYLSCTGSCVNNTITSTGTPPQYVDYIVCGQQANCKKEYVCDTFRVQFSPPLSVSIAPSNPALCNGQTATTITAIGSGGTPPYIFLWNNVNPSQSISVGAGTYNVKLSDASGCPPAYASAVVTSYSVPVSISAGPDILRCVTNPLAPLGATVTGASGVLWSGGTGTFSPNSTSSSNLFYSPSSAELSAGAATLFVTTTGSGFCPAATDTVVIRYSNFTGTVVTTVTPVACYGYSNGAVSLSVTGGQAPHTYSWQTTPAVSGPLFTNKPTGTYFYTIFDNIGCVRPGSVTISQPAMLALSHTVTQAKCFGSSDGSATVTASGGTSPYTYSWIPVSQSGSVASTLAAGNYTCKLTDSKGCTTSSLISITQPATISVVATQTNIICNNAATGAISTTVTGGSAPYSYSWSPLGSTAPGLSNLTAGTYTLRVTDQQNCLATRTVVISQPPALTITLNVTNETCSYLNDGIISANVSGGTSGYTYLWSPGAATSSAITNLTSGNYSVTVLDGGNCIISGSATVTQPTPLAVSLVNYAEVRCFGGTDGSVTAVANGGIAAYNYSWSPPGITSANLTNQPAGSYTVFVSDANTCTTSAVQVITQPDVLSQSAIINTVSCAGGNNASLTLSVTGGTGNYQYLWLPGSQTTATLSPVIAGNYTAVVADANNCTLAATYSVAEPQPINIIFAAVPVSCFGGTNGIATTTVSGGHAPYTYSWSAGAVTSSLGGLASGIYTVTVTDNLLCTAVATVSITEPAPLTVTVSFTNESCDYSDDGSATATGAGGSPPYSYTWQPGTLTSPNISGLSAGFYSVAVSDNNACVTSTQVTIDQPAPLIPVASSSAVSCFGGSDGMAFVQTSGGTPNYHYTFSPSGSTLSTAANLSAGFHTVEVTDDNGCVAQTTVEVTEPTALTTAETITNVSCFNGSDGMIAISPSGGTSPFSFFWNHSGQTSSAVNGLSIGTYTVLITDVNNCTLVKTYTVGQPPVLSISSTIAAVSCFGGADGTANVVAGGGTAPYVYSWAHGPSASAVNGLSATVYSVTVTDNLSCVLTETIVVSEPAKLVLATTFSNETCNYNNDGSATVTANGGTPVYSYTWLPGGMTAAAVSGLSAGTYTVLAEDALMCIEQATVTISEPANLSITFNQIAGVSCAGGNDGSVLGVAAGGTPNYTFAWSSGAATSALNSSLSAGNHTLTVTDNNGCVTTNTVTVTEPLPLTISAITSQVQCAGGSDGAISLSINGGTPPYANIIMPGNVSGSNFSNLSAGNYTIYSTDDNGCVSSGTVTLSEPLTLSTVGSYTNPTCGQPNGTAKISVTSGGVPPFTYSWMPSGGTASVATALDAGSHTVMVTDATGCISTKFIDVSNIGAPVVVVSSATNVSCNGGSDAAIEVNVNGGSPPFTYSWSPSGGSTNLATNLQAGYYSISVTDILGCLGVATSSLIFEPKPISFKITTVAVSCNTGNDGAASAQVTGGTPGYTYTWESGTAAGNTTSGLTAGNYSVNITDTKACSHTATFTVSEPPPLSLTVSSSSVSCFGGNDGTATGTASGGTPPYSYSWTPVNAGTQHLQNTAAGIYTLTATDQNGCGITSTVEVIEPAPITLTVLTQNSDCSLPNGQATVSASGGNGGFSYAWIPSTGNASVAVALSAGSHSVYVTDINLCPASITLSINDNPAPSVAITTVTHVSCFNGFDGVAEATVTGGTAPFNYTWSPSGGNVSVASGLAVGQYSLLVVSANNCSVNAVSPFITQPFPVVISVSTTSVLCFGDNGGSATVTAFGGTGAYTYSWQSGIAAGNQVSGLSAGVYTVEVRDVNNCFAVASFTIKEPAQQLSIAVAGNSVFCHGGNNGSASVTATGGTAPYNLVWSPGQLSSASIYSLVSGIYSVSVNDMNGCSAQQTVSIDEPPVLVLTPDFLPSNCSATNGQASVAVSGGIAPYTYSWSPSGGTAAVAQSLFAGVYSVTVTDANSCVATASTAVSDIPAPTVSVTSVTSISCNGGFNGTATATITGGVGPFSFLWSAGTGLGATVTGLSAGQHTVVVTSANACTVEAVTPLITQPASVNIVFYTTAVGCFAGNDGSAQASVFGGTPPYSYNWAPTAHTTALVQGMTAGDYTLTITDANSCVNTASVQVAQPANPLTLTVISSSVLCFGDATGAATVIANGGTAPYSYNWNPAASTASQVAGLAAGIHTVQSLDKNGCPQTATVAIAEPVLPLALTLDVNDANCFGNADGSATITPSGGTPLYNINWSSGTSTAAVVNGLVAGTYSVLVSDQNLCNASLSFTVNQPAQLTGTLLVTDPSCGRQNGSLNAQISGGTGPFVYQWSAGNQNGSSASVLSPGNYSLFITDAHNCPAVFTATLVEIPGPTATLTAINKISCFGLADGGATVAASGVSPGFTYQWLPYGGNTTVAQGLSAGVYTAIVTDTLGCTATATADVTQPDKLRTTTDSVKHVSCKGFKDGAISMSVFGGTQPYTYSWSSGDTAPTADSLVAGTYTLQTADLNNCTYSVSANLTEPPLLTATAGVSRQILCFGGTGNATVAIDGGSAPYSLNWTSSPPQNGNVLHSVPAGSYTVSVKDSKGCIALDSVIMVQPSQIATAVSQIDTVCAGTNSMLVASADGGAGGYYFNWAPEGAINAGTLQVTASSDINYTVVAFDENGCAGSDAVSAVHVFNLVDSDFQLLGYSPVCPGQTSVLEANLNGNPGPVTYTWSHDLPSGAGPYIVQPSSKTVYTVTVSNACGFTVKKTTTVEIAAPPVASLSADSLFTCVPGSIQFRETGESINSADPVVEWTWNFSTGEISGEKDPLYYLTTAGIYSVNLTVITDRGCVGTSTTPIVVTGHPQPVASFTLNKYVLQLPYDELVCTNLSEGAVSFNWNFGNGIISNLPDPRVKLQTVGENAIQLIAISEFGCSDTTTQYVTSSSELIFPNAFTPNELGSSGGAYDMSSLNNDVFFPYTSGVEDYSLQVFNRWGELIFESTDVRIGWDGYYRGVLCQQGVYVWKASASLGDGKKFSQSGTLTLLRK